LKFVFDLSLLQPGRRAPQAYPQSNGSPFMTTIVREIKFDGCAAPPGVSIFGNAVVVEELGTFYFGELVLGNYLSSLSMIRLALGSDCGGDGTAGYTEPHGQRP